MAELEVDQTSLPNVQEVCQCFAVLEDGALAHNLQEQEIEQYYSSNVQRNQLVQNDIRVAKRLQDEEQQRAYMLHHQATLRLEEEDLQYARRVQEEIQRCADEAQRREAEDEEIAKRIQEEEELLVRQWNDCQRTNRVNADAPSPSNAVRPVLPLLSEEDEPYNQASSPSPSSSDFEEERPNNRGHSYVECREPLEQRHQSVHETPRRRSSGRESQCSSSTSSSRTGPFRGAWADVVRLIKNDLSEQGYMSYSSEDELFEPVYKIEKILNQQHQNLERCSERGERLARHSSVREAYVRPWQGVCAGRSESLRGSEYDDSRWVRSEGRQVRRYSSSCSDRRPVDGQRRVHFQDDSRRHNGCSDSRRAFERIRGQEVGGYTVSSYPVRRDIIHHQTPFSYSTAANGGQFHSQRQGPQNTTRPRHVDQGDVPLGRRALAPDSSRVYIHENLAQQESRVAEVREEGERPCNLREWRRAGGSFRVRGECRQRAHTPREEERPVGRERRRYRSEQSGRRVRREHRQGEEERSSTEEEEVERERERRREERRARRLPQRSLSLSCREHSSRAGPPLARDGASLNLGELEQVLLDEELARRLQAEEEKLLRRDPQPPSSVQSPYPEGDFKVAQVAQDEEIARFMQKQEIRAKRPSEEVEEGGPGQECRNSTDGRAEHDRQVQRERLDSEGLLSPAEEEFTPECQPSSLVSSPITTPLHAHFRNIAEELDPTFQRNENVQAGQNISGPCQMQASPQPPSHDLLEEPAFVPPTKRQNEKTGRGKSREKKENPKLKENCKQQ